MRNFEHLIAVAFMKWWAYWSRANGIDEKLLFHIPNGAARHIVVAKKLKAEGVRAGVSDYFLAMPAGDHYGLFIELKAGGPGIAKGRLNPEQAQFGKLVVDQGFCFTVAYGINEAVKAVESYVTIPEKVGSTA